jgi:hypothetical protein
VLVVALFVAVTLSVYKPWGVTRSYLINAEGRI